jgi:hypothetical protein
MVVHLFLKFWADEKRGNLKIISTLIDVQLYSNSIVINLLEFKIIVQFYHILFLVSFEVIDNSVLSFGKGWETEVDPQIT